MTEKTEKILSDRISELEEENKSLKKQYAEAILKCQSYDFCFEKFREYNEILVGTHPIKVYYHRKRRNTTVRFLDGSSVTVHRMKGDKHSLDTAVAYALVKKRYPKKLIKDLVEGADIKGGRKCKKNCKN